VTSSALTEPFTPRGIAAFARARFRRLALAQAIVAVLAATALTWFLNDNCFSIIHAAIQAMPDAGKISHGKLEWHGDSPAMLAEGKFLAFDVDLNHSGAIRSTADIQVEFGRSSLRFLSLLGYSDLFYEPDRSAPFNRIDLEPRWGAWADEILLITFAAIFFSLLLSWALLATIYFLPVWLLSFFTNRDLSPAASWKLAGAALMPGALVLSAGVLLYNAGFLNLVSFGFFFAAHFVVGWIYLALSPLFLPRTQAEKPKGNPFNQAKA
jgi:hypothetical protein